MLCRMWYTDIQHKSTFFWWHFFDSNTEKAGQKDTHWETWQVTSLVRKGDKALAKASENVWWSAIRRNVPKGGHLERIVFQPLCFRFHVCFLGSNFLEICCVEDMILATSPLKAILGLTRTPPYPVNVCSRALSALCSWENPSTNCSKLRFLFWRWIYCHTRVTGIIFGTDLELCYGEVGF